MVVHLDAAVETARPKQRGVQHVGAVCGRDEDHTRVRLETIHFHEQLIEGLLSLVVAAAQAGEALSAHGVDLVDEDDARPVRLRLLK